MDRVADMFVDAFPNWAQNESTPDARLHLPGDIGSVAPHRLVDRPVAEVEEVVLELPDPILDKVLQRSGDLEVGRHSLVVAKQTNGPHRCSHPRVAGRLVTWTAGEARVDRFDPSQGQPLSTHHSKFLRPVPHGTLRVQFGTAETSSGSSRPPATAKRFQRSTGLMIDG